MKNRLRKISLIVLSFITFFVFIGCSKETLNIDKKSNIDKKLKVAVSIMPQETFVKVVGGDLVEVVTMIPPGNSPANYAPSPRELQLLSKSSLYFSIGVPTEKANIIHKLSDINEDIQLISLEEEVSKVYKEREFSKGNRDQHIWLSPKRVKIMIKTIKDKLSEVDPKNKLIYEENAQNYIEKLAKLDKSIKSTIENLPKKSFLVYHPAFGYFADDYGLKMIPIEKEGKEANIQDIKEIVDYAKKEGIKVVFYQSEIDSKQANVIAEEIGGKTQAISPLAPNYIENLENMANAFAKYAKK